MNGLIRRKTRPNPDSLPLFTTSDTTTTSCHQEKSIRHGLDSRRRVSQLCFWHRRVIKRSQRRHRTKHLLLLFAFFLCFSLVVVSPRRRWQYQFNHPGLGKLQHTATERVIISIGTVAKRQTELLRTLETIALQQSVTPGKIRISYTTLEDGVDYPVEDVISKTTSLLAKHVENGQRLPDIQFINTPAHWKTARKLLGTLHEAWNGTSPPSAADSLSEEPLIVLADDDFLYSHRWLESLLVGHTKLPDAAVGLRGWRIREDLRYGAPPLPGHHPDGVWGSFPATERYVIQGSRLYDAYRVGVLVGCSGVLVRPSFFDAGIFEAPTAMHFSLNDVWNSGNLASRSVERWVIPMLGQQEVGTHLGDHSSVIKFQGTGVGSRGVGNSKMLQYFEPKWDRNLWWSVKDSPPLRGLLPLWHWFSENVILVLHSVKWIRQAVGDFKLKDE